MLIFKSKKYFFRNDILDSVFIARDSELSAGIFHSSVVKCISCGLIFGFAACGRPAISSRSHLLKRIKLDTLMKRQTGSSLSSEPIHNGS